MMGEISGMTPNWSEALHDLGEGLGLWLVRMLHSELYGDPGCSQDCFLGWLSGHG